MTEKLADSDLWLVFTALREADRRLSDERERHRTRELLLRDRVAEERDRRYAEVQVERQRALQYKEQGDQTALELARVHQTYLDLQANRLREQISSERGDYVRREEFKRVENFVIAQGGRATVWAVVLSLLFLAIAASSFVVPLLRSSPAPVAPPAYQVELPISDGKPAN